MGDLTEQTAQLDPGLEAFIRLRMMGVHVAHQARGRRARGEVRPDRPALHRVLAELGLMRGDITQVHWYTARRPVARIAFTRGRPVVLKWLDEGEPDSDNEMWALTLLGGRPLPGTLGAALPRVLGTTADGGVHAFAYVEDALPWADTEVAADHLTVLARCLAELHTLGVSGPADRRLRFPVPSLSRLTPAEYALGYGADFAEYTATMQSIDGELTDLRETWRADAYIHFDLRDDNVLFGTQRPTVALVDWETAGFGDPGYDVGTVVGQMLARRIPALRTGNEPRALDHALAAAGAFLRTYRRHARADSSIVLRSLRFAGVFLLLNCLGRLEKVGSLGRIGHLYLLVGRNLVLRPEAGLAAVAAEGRG